MLTKSVCYIVPVWLPASVFILVISKKSSTFAADFKSRNVMCRRIRQLLVCFIMISLFAACSDGGGYVQSIPNGSDISLSAGALTNKEKDKVFKDTITPPNNPMNEVPYVPGAFTFKGVLQLEYYGTELYCVVRGVNNNYFLMDNGVNYLFRLDHPLLSDCCVGDTIVVTAEPMKVQTHFSLATYYVMLNNISKD